jgi:hypothetical protein
MRTIVLDSGAFIAAERRERRLVDFLEAAAREGATILLPAVVVAEMWRDPPRPLSAKLVGTADVVVPLDLSKAQSVGGLLGKTQTSQIVDANVATMAVDFNPSLVLTSDPADLELLVRALGASCSVSPKRTRGVAVIIEPL